MEPEGAVIDIGPRQRFGGELDHANVSPPAQPVINLGNVSTRRDQMNGDIEGENLEYEDGDYSQAGQLPDPPAAVSAGIRPRRQLRRPVSTQHRETQGNQYKETGWNPDKLKQAQPVRDHIERIVMPGYFGAV